MNLALGAILIAILLISPLLFLFCFRIGAHVRGMPKLSLVEYFLLSSILSLFIHTAIIYAFSLDVDFKFIIQFISGQFQDVVNKNTDEILKDYFFDFAKYNFWLCLSSVGFGYVLGFIATHKRFRRMEWLQKLRGNRKPISFFQYFNRWWYYFRANEYDSNYLRLGMDEPLVYVDVLVDTKNESILYSGILQEFSLKDNDLENLYLTTISKRLFSIKQADGATSLQEGEGYIITPDGTMCIPFSKIINIYVRFLSTDPQITGGDTTVDLADFLRSNEPEESPDA